MRLLTDMRRVLLLGGLLSAGLTLAPPARAAPPAAQANEVGRLQAECARLRSELQRANADVAALKRGDQGVRNDYRLRQRMADAEALARKLTEAEAQLRVRTGATPAPHAPTLAPPSAEPGDGPVELEAKADLLSDQARRLAAQAEDLARTAGQLRGRQTLRKRAFQLERDPFASMEGSKRSLVFGGSNRLSSGPTKGGGSPEGSKGLQPGGGAMDTGTRGGGGASGGSSGSGNGNPMPTTGSPTPTAQPGAAPPPTAPPTQMPPTSGDSSKGAEFTAPPPQPTGAISTQLRTLLDPATLSEVQRLERAGKPLTDPEALEKLAAALRQRAQSLEAQSKSLRAKAKP
jgi:hypothetical protein